MTEIRPDGEHWRFSLELYSVENFPRSCLYLQENHCVDVNVLLLVLYAGLKKRRRIGEREVAVLDDSIRTLREELVLPLRRIRRMLKPLPFGHGTEPLRMTVKKAELEAEQFLQLCLARSIEQLPPGQSPGPLESCRLVVRHFDRAADLTLPPTQSAMLTIAQACEKLSEEAVQEGDLPKDGG